MDVQFHPYLGHACWGKIGQTPKSASFAKLWPELFSLKPELPADIAIYDLASLTKVICTSSLLASEYLKSNLGWESFLNLKLSDEIPELKNTAFEQTTLGEVWEHRSGVRPWKACFSPQRSDDWKRQKRSELWSTALNAILKESVSAEKKVIYSDLGFLLLGLYIERKKNADLSSLWSEWKQNRNLPHDILTYGTEERTHQKGELLVPTEIRHGQGQVNDDNTWSMGGVAPHAGLFGSCHEVWRWLEEIQTWTTENKKLKDWITPHPQVLRFHGGWDTPGEPETTQAGAQAPAGTLGHLGFTGTAFWWNPKSKLAGVLLSARVYPEHSPQTQAQIRMLRREFFSWLWSAQINV